MATLGYKWLHWVKCGYTGLHMVAGLTYIYSDLHTVTLGYTWLQWVSYGYTRLQIVTLDYTWLQ